MKKSLSPFCSLSLSIATALLLAGTASPAIAQTQAENEENWYQVEMLVFKRAAQGNTNETWPKNLALAFPPNFQYLNDPKQTEPELTEQDETTLEGEPVALSDAPQQDTEPTIISPVQDQTQAEQNPVEKPFILFPEERFFIANAKSAVSREQEMKILFHETWAQPMKALESSPAIVIRGGEYYGEHAELEGTVTISLSRYLHIHTDLWLAEYEANYGQADDHWPQIPLPPKPLTDEAILAAAETEHIQMPGETSGADGSGLNINLTAGSPLGMETTAGNTFTPSYISQWTSLTEQPFLVKSITTLNQKRRMRSNELHYIDHPRMGILIKILPYTPSHLQVEEEDAS